MEKYHHYILCWLTLHPSSTIPHHTENVDFTRFALLKSRAFSYIFGISVERSGDTWSKVVDKLKTLWTNPREEEVIHKDRKELIQGPEKSEPYK